VAIALCALVLAPASPARASRTCTYIAGSGNTRMIVILVGETASHCTTFARTLSARPFSGHVNWPERCRLINPSSLAIIGVLTPNAAWGRAVCSLLVKRGWIR
jgi:hypothetical protein